MHRGMHITYIIMAEEYMQGSANNTLHHSPLLLSYAVMPNNAGWREMVRDGAEICGMLQNGPGYCGMLLNNQNSLIWCGG